ncbi:TPA: translation elongation factor Ts [bacterium]|nr:MAG: translation elongation factor Ts [Candidatus Hydrogenedentes bacterium CG1_02_42_14]PIU48083.1 MAG: translation elongation factor Ts [Candidatus Hydrogenedentes bacterium CG07_land_8_20_14_0_80_42_17]HBW47848.1 translation elongation factor Ts [bacterium]
MSYTPTADEVKKLREETQAGMLDCKKAIQDANGDFEKAKDILRKKGLASVSKRSDRVASNGSIASYVHHGGRIGVLIEVRCETDFVARTDEFQKMGKTLAMQVAVSRPRYVKREDAPVEIVEREKKIYAEQASESGKPQQVVEKMVQGKLEKYFAEICLLDQEFMIGEAVKSTAKTVNDYVIETAAKLGEKVDVIRFVRMELGESTGN